MSTREERRQQRIARLLERLEAAAANWAAAEYQEGIGTGRHGAVSARVTQRRDKAEQAFKDIVARLSHATCGQAPSQPLGVEKATPGERIRRPNRAAGGRATAEKRKRER